MVGAASGISTVDLVRLIEAFDYFNMSLLNAGAYGQISPATGQAYTLGPGGAQVYPINYLGG